MKIYASAVQNSWSPTLEFLSECFSAQLYQFCTNFTSDSRNIFYKLRLISIRIQFVELLKNFSIKMAQTEWHTIIWNPELQYGTFEQKSRK